MGSAETTVCMACVGVLSTVWRSSSASPHVEFLLLWVQALCTRHGEVLKKADTSIMPVLRGLQKALGRLHADLADTAEGNLYSLRYLAAVAGAQKQQAVVSEDGDE